MIVFPNAKINLGLKILSQREDGFHNLETIYLPVGFSDILEVLPGGKKDHFRITGYALPGDPSENLVLRALRVMREELTVPPVRIHLHKIIPPGTGLGGGSSDGAFTLMLLNKLFALECPVSILHTMAARLGADCSFFVYNKIAGATGKGDVITPMDPLHGSYYLILLIPDFSIRTASAFRSVSYDNTLVSPFEAYRKSPEKWKDLLKNQFEQSGEKEYASCRGMIQWLYGCGAIYASLSGSGSAVFGIFRDIPDHCDNIRKYIAWTGTVGL